MAATKKKISTVKSKKPHMRSLRRSDNEGPFFTLRVTQQSAYWLILCLLVLALGVWVISLSVKVHTIYDQVDREDKVSAHIQIPTTATL
jgi:hypothetical protein